MDEWKKILSRLKNPSVVLSIFAQIITILSLLNVNVDLTIAKGILTAVCSILVLLGIMSNPTTENKGYGDDMLLCSHCNKKSPHVLICGEMICTECGCIFKK